MTIDIRKQLGAKIKQLRKAQNISQEKLAEMMGITTNGVGNFETGRTFPSISNFEKLLKVFEIEPYELFLFDKNVSIHDIVYNDVIKKIEKIRNNPKKLFVISQILDGLK